MLKRLTTYSFFYASMVQKSALKVKNLKIIAQFKKIVATRSLNLT